jgi:hypothetical protein
VFTARYALSSYIKQIRFVFKVLLHSLQTERTKRVITVVPCIAEYPFCGSEKLFSYTVIFIINSKVYVIYPFYYVQPAYGFVGIDSMAQFDGFTERVIY